MPAITAAASAAASGQRTNTTTQATQPTLAQHFSAPLASFAALGLNPDQLASEHDADTLSAIQQALQLNGLVRNIQPRARVRMSTGGQAPRRERRAAIVPHDTEAGAADGLTRMPAPEFGPGQYWVETIFELADPAEEGVAYVGVTRSPSFDDLSRRDAFGLPFSCESMYQTSPSPRPEHREVERMHFETWDRVESWERGRGRRADGRTQRTGGRVAPVSDDEDEVPQLPNAGISHEGMLAAESVGIRVASLQGGLIHEETQAAESGGSRVAPEEETRLLRERVRDWLG